MNLANPLEPLMDPVTRRALLPLAAALLLASAPAVSAEPDAGERKFIRQGMGEGEVVLKIGPPDHEAVHRAVRGQPEEKTWTYFPHPRDPQTLTIVRFQAGRVAEVRRERVRAAAPMPTSCSRPSSDSRIREWSSPVASRSSAAAR